MEVSNLAFRISRRMRLIASSGLAGGGSWELLIEPERAGSPSGKERLMSGTEVVRTMPLKCGDSNCRAAGPGRLIVFCNISSAAV